MTNTYALIDAAGVVENTIVLDDGSTYAPPPGLTLRPTNGPVSIGWVLDGDTFVDPSPAPPEPRRITRLELRRRLYPSEAQWFDAAQAIPPLTETERAMVFDPALTTPELQLRAAVRDAMLQWGLLDVGVIEMDHADTLEFLQVLGAAGMFGDQAHIRIPQILATA